MEAKHSTSDNHDYFGTKIERTRAFDQAKDGIKSQVCLAYDTWIFKQSTVGAATTFERLHDVENSFFEDFPALKSLPGKAAPRFWLVLFAPLG